MKPSVMQTRGFDTTVYPDGAVVCRTEGAFASLVKVVNVKCEDGKRRVASVTGQPDIEFSTPARVSAKGKTVSGFLSMKRDDWRFTATGKNAWTMVKGCGHEGEPEGMTSCPYEADIYDDPTPMCRCCVDCQNNCRMDI